jgi:diguanylate cyclase (GGDEF)-like protein
MNFAEKIRELVEEMRIETQAGVISATVSVGVATVPHPKIHSPKELIVAADKALYRAKKNGRNQVQAERRSDPDRARAVKSGESPIDNGQLTIDS